MRQVKRIIVHATATKEGQWFDVEEIRKWHTTPEDLGGRGWSDIGYHFIILLNGVYEVGRPLWKTGAHTVGFNKDSIGIAYVGGLDENGKAKDTRTEDQKAGLRQLIKVLLETYPEIDEVQGHRDYSPDRNKDGIISPDEWIKQCPCFDAGKEYQNLITKKIEP